VVLVATLPPLSVGLGILIFVIGVILRLIRLRKTVTRTSKLAENIQGCPPIPGGGPGQAPSRSNPEYRPLRHTAKTLASDISLILDPPGVIEKGLNVALHGMEAAAGVDTTKRTSTAPGRWRALRRWCGTPTYVARNISGLLWSDLVETLGAERVSRCGHVPEGVRMVP
jgi:hypothetical protein